MRIQAGPRLRIPISSQTAWFVKTTKNPDLDGELRRRFWPLPHTNCLISRLRNGLLFTNQYFSHVGAGEMVVSCGEGRRLVLIDVSHNQGVCFSMRHLIGLTANVRIESYINLSVAASGADRNFVYMAWCPSPTEQGALLLETTGEPTTLRNGQGTFDMRRLLAWDPRVEFRLEELVGMVDVLMTHPHAKARWNCDDDAVLLAADDSEGEQFIRRVLRQAISIVVPGF
jgi:hypothetical protein